MWCDYLAITSSELVLWEALIGMLHCSYLIFATSMVLQFQDGALGCSLVAKEERSTARTFQGKSASRSVPVELAVSEHQRAGVKTMHLQNCLKFIWMGCHLIPFICLQNDKIYLLQNSCNNYKPSKQCFFNFVFSGVNCANHASHIHQNNSQNICRNAHSSHDVRVKNRIVTDGPFKGHKVKNNKILFLLTILQPRRTFYNVLGRDFRNKMYK